VYKSRKGLEEHLRQQHLDTFPESQLHTIIKVGETSTVEMREKCPVCFLPAGAEGMGDFTNHVANHLERFAAFALPNSSEEDEDGTSSAANGGISGNTSSQDVSDMPLPSAITDEQEDGEEPIMELRRSDEDSLTNRPGTQTIPPGTTLLSVESLLSLPDTSHNRLDALLVYDPDELDEDVDEETDKTTAEIQEHLDLIENFRTYMLSLPGASTVRFFRRYGAWRGNVIFGDESHAAQALELFDKSLYPQVVLQQGTESNRNKLKFSVPNTERAIRPPSARQPTSKTEIIDDKDTSSTSITYDDIAAAQRKGAVLTISEIPTLRDLYRSRKLLQRDQSFAPNDSYNRIISFCYCDITRLKVDAIVNSANVSMAISRNEMTLNHFVHKAGGLSFSEEAKSKGKVKPGQAVLTGGHNLPCSFVIHAARPSHSTNQGMGQFNILTECYRSALKIALDEEYKSIAFPCLGAGGCGFPPKLAARVALQEVREFLDSHVKHPFERLVIVVYSALDEKAYMDLLPVFFPPTHGDLEVSRSFEPSADRASLAVQVLEVRLQVQKVAEELSSELSLFISDFPKEVLDELHGIDSALASIRSFLLGTKALGRSLKDLELLCSILQTICGSITEVTESAKHMPFSGGRSHKDLWDDYNNHHIMVHESNLEQFLKDCQDFAQCLDDVLTRGGIESDEMTPIRLRLSSFKSTQKSEGAEGIRNRLDEVLYTREYQRETTVHTRDVVRLHQIPSIAQLYSSNQLEERPTMAKPSVAFNHTVCLAREDITSLEVSVMVNSTDVSFAGTGTLDRKVFNKGGPELREECLSFGVCAEGTVKVTPGYQLPAKHIIHVVPPGQYKKNTKDVLRQIYREILYTATSLRATSVAIPSIGTGMLNYPRQDCASLALEEVKRFLETAEPTTVPEKIVIVVYSSNDDFIYKSLLPVYFPPIDQKVKRALPASHPISISASSPPATITAPRRTLFDSIGDAVRNLGGSRLGKRPVSHTARAVNTYEEHALIGFESHARDCATCKHMEQLCLDGRSLCEHGYPLAQTLLWYMTLGPDQLVYTRPVQIRQSVRLEVPEDVFPLSLTLLRLVETSLREEGRNTPFVSPNRAYSTVVRGQTEPINDEVDPAIYSAEKARAYVKTSVDPERTWDQHSLGECDILLRPGRMDIYEAHASPATQDPVLAFHMDSTTVINKHSSQPGLVLHGAFVAAFDTERIMLVSQTLQDANALLAMLHRANPDFPMTWDDLDTEPEDSLRDKVETDYKRNRDLTRVDEEGEHSSGFRTATNLASTNARTNFLEGRLESGTEREENLTAAQQSTKDVDSMSRDGQSSLQVRMQKFSEAGSRFSVEPYDELSTITRQPGKNLDTSSHRQSASRDQTDNSSSQKTPTALERRVLFHLHEDLKTRPGSYIGQHVKDIASALNEPLAEVSKAMVTLARKDYIHNTTNEDTWVVSHPPEQLPVLLRQQEESEISQAIPAPEASRVNKTDNTDVLFQIELLEQQILSVFAIGKPEGHTALEIAYHVQKEVEEVELALEQLAEQGKVRLAPDGETWTTFPLSGLDHDESIPTTESATIRDAKAFQDTPPSPIIPAADADVQKPPVEIIDSADLEKLDTGESDRHHPAGTHWTRIPKSQVNPQVLVQMQEDFHEENESLILHRVLRRGELKQWMDLTWQLERQKERAEVRRERRGVSGHTWLAKGKDEKDVHQANLDRVLAGDMSEVELRHFAEEDDKKRVR
jgi:O-acetyl-ADP-ribose deacetylase (regulator of RNase III)